MLPTYSAAQVGKSIFTFFEKCTFSEIKWLFEWDNPNLSSESDSTCIFTYMDTPMLCFIITHKKFPNMTKKSWKMGVIRFQRVISLDIQNISSWNFFQNIFTIYTQCDSIYRPVRKSWVFWKTFLKFESYKERVLIFDMSKNVKSNDL